MRLKIARILSTSGRVTTALFVDGGQELVATGVGTFSAGQEVIVYMDDRYNRLKFHSSSAIDKQLPTSYTGRMKGSHS